MALQRLTCSCMQLMASHPPPDYLPQPWPDLPRLAASTASLLAELLAWYSTASLRSIALPPLSFAYLAASYEADELVLLCIFACAGAAQSTATLLWVLFSTSPLPCFVPEVAPRPFKPHPSLYELQVLMLMASSLLSCFLLLASPEAHSPPLSPPYIFRGSDSVLTCLLSPPSTAEALGSPRLTISSSVSYLCSSSL